MNHLLRDSFSAINARFHLVGIYALVALLVRFAEDWTGDDPSGAPLLLGALILYVAVTSGVFGLLFQAAMGPKESLSFLRWALALFLPIFWLSFKIGLVQAWLIALAATAHNLATGTPLPASLDTVAYWGRPATDLVTLLLTLYSVPVCILSRVRREWRPAIRQGLTMFRASPSESARLALLVVAVAAIENSLHFALGRGGQKSPPGYPEGLVALAGAYLTLVAYFGAMRVVLSRFATGPREAVIRPDSAAPGPAA